MRLRVALALLALFYGIAQNLIRPILAPHISLLGGGAELVGLTLGIGAVGGLVAAIPVGGMLDRLGSTRILLLGAGTMIAGSLVMAFTSNPFALAAGYTLYNGGGVGVWISAQALATVAPTTEQMRKQVSSLSTAVLVGQLVSPALGGVVGQLFDTHLVFVLTAASSAGILLILLLPDAPTTPRRPGQQGQHARASGMTLTFDLLRRPGFLTTLLTSMTAMTIQATIQGFLPLHLVSIGWSLTAIGVTMSAFGAGSIVARTTFSLLVKRLSPAGVTAISLLPSALAMIVVCLWPTGFAVLPSVVVAGFAVGLAQPLALVIVSTITQNHERGRAVGIRTFGNRLIQAVAPTAVGLGAGLAGLGPAFIAIGGICVAAGAGISLAERRRGAAGA